MAQKTPRPVIGFDRDPDYYRHGDEHVQRALKVTRDQIRKIRKRKNRARYLRMVRRRAVAVG